MVAMMVAFSPYSLRWQPSLLMRTEEKDMGKSWEKSPFTPENPMFDDTDKNNGSVRIGAPHMVDFGQGMK